MSTRGLIDLYLFRHGETDWNLSRRLQGHTDVPLNEQGRLQAAKLGERIKDLSMDLVLTSDLKRATETATIAFSNRNLEFHASPKLREMNLGEAEGHLREDVQAQFGMQAWQEYADPHFLDFRFPGGELKAHALQRVKDHIQSVIQQTKVQRLAVSTHGGILRLLVHSCSHSPLEPVPIPNCVLFHLTVDGDRWSYSSSPYQGSMKYQNC